MVSFWQPISKIALFSLTIVGTTLNVSSCTPANTSQVQTSPQSQQQQVIKISGSGSVYPALKSLVKTYETKNPQIKIDFLPPNQTEGGINGVKNNLVDIGLATRPLKPEEDNGKIAHREIAKDALLVATHPSVTGVKNLTTENLKAIYSGAIANWKQLGGPDAKIVLLDRPEDESAKKLLRKYYLGQDLKNSPSATILSQESELIAALQETPYAIGAFSLAYAIGNQLPVNQLSLNGITPTPENVLTDKYQMVRHINIISQKTPSSSTQGFIDFATSPEGKLILLKAGFAPIKK